MSRRPVTSDLVVELKRALSEQGIDTVRDRGRLVENLGPSSLTINVSMSKNSIAPLGLSSFIVHYRLEFDRSPDEFGDNFESAFPEEEWKELLQRNWRISRGAWDKARQTYGEEVYLRIISELPGIYYDFEVPFEDAWRAGAIVSLNALGKLTFSHRIREYWAFDANDVRSWAGYFVDGHVAIRTRLQAFAERRR